MDRKPTHWNVKTFAVPSLIVLGVALVVGLVATDVGPSHNVPVVEAAPDLGIVKDAQGLDDGNREYRFEARNNGDPLVQGDIVTLVDDMDDQLVIVAIHDVNPGWSCGISAVNVVTCQLVDNTSLGEQFEEVAFVDVCDTIVRGSVSNDASILLNGVSQDSDTANPNVPACEAPTPTPTPTETPTDTPTPTPTTTESPTETPTPTPTSTEPPSTGTPTPTPTEPSTGTPTPTPTERSTGTPTPTPTEPLSTGTPTPTATTADTATPTPTPSLPAVAPANETPTPTPTPTKTPPSRGTLGETPPPPAISGPISPPSTGDGGLAGSNRTP